MQRIMVLFCLTVTMSGPLCRQAEAASDFVRAHAILLDGGGTLSVPDGGVGDDKGEVTLKAGDSHDLASDLGPSRDPWRPINGLASPILVLSPLDFGASDLLDARPSRYLAGARQRYSWLQHFRF